MKGSSRWFTFQKKIRRKQYKTNPIFSYLTFLQKNPPIRKQPILTPILSLRKNYILQIQFKKMLNGGGLQDQMLKTYIDSIFQKYDTDNSGTLDEQQMTFFFNDLFKSLGMNITVTEQQSLEAIRSIDQNFDGGVDKKELFDAFKMMMANSQNKPPNNQPPPPNMYGSSPYQQNPYQQNPYQQNPNQNNPYQNNPYQNNPYQNNPYQNNPYQPPQNPYQNPYQTNNPYQPQNPYQQYNPYQQQPPQTPYQQQSQGPYQQQGYMNNSQGFGGGWGKKTR